MARLVASDTPLLDGVHSLCTPASYKSVRLQRLRSIGSARRARHIGRRSPCHTRASPPEKCDVELTENWPSVRAHRRPSFCWAARKSLSAARRWAALRPNRLTMGTTINTLIQPQYAEMRIELVRALAPFRKRAKLWPPSCTLSSIKLPLTSTWISVSFQYDGA